jgi:hypothetical protein
MLQIFLDVRISSVLDIFEAYIFNMVSNRKCRIIWAERSRWRIVGGLSARLRGYEAAAFKFPAFHPDENSIKGKCDTTRKEKKSAIEFTRIFSTRIDSTDISKISHRIRCWMIIDLVIDHARKHVSSLNPCRAAATATYSLRL